MILEVMSYLPCNLYWLVRKQIWFCLSDKTSNVCFSACNLTFTLRTNNLIMIKYDIVYWQNNKELSNRQINMIFAFLQLWVLALLWNILICFLGIILIITYILLLSFKQLNSCLRYPKFLTSRTSEWLLTPA